MNKILVICCVLLPFVVLFMIIVTNSKDEHQKIDYSNKSNSERNHNEHTQRILFELEAEYGHEFRLASKKIEDRMYGIWKAKGDAFGFNHTVRVQWDAFTGGVIIFHENAIIYSNRIWYKPVFAYYKTLVKDMERDPLNLRHSDDNYANSEAIVVVAMNAEPDKFYGPASSRQHMQSVFIIIDDMLILGGIHGEAFFVLTKIGEVMMY